MTACVSVCAQRAVKGNRLELSISNMEDVYFMTGRRHALILRSEGQTSRSRGYQVRCRRRNAVRHKTATVSSLLNIQWSGKRLYLGVYVASDRSDAGGAMVAYRRATRRVCSTSSLRLAAAETACIRSTPRRTVALSAPATSPTLPKVKQSLRVCAQSVFRVRN